MTDQNAQQLHKPRFFYGYIVVAVAFSTMLLVNGTRFSFGVFFKPMLTELGWTRAMASGAFSLSMIVNGCLSIVMGGLNDRLGPRIVVTFCGLFLGLGYLLMSQVGAIWQLYLFYGLITGIGASGLWVPILSTVARWFTKRRGTMTGVVLGGVGLGTLIVSPVANHLISAYDWRISYIMMGSFVLVVLVSLAQFLKRDPTQVGQVPYGESRDGGQEVASSGEGFSLSNAVHTRQFWLVAAMNFCFGFLFITILIHIVPHATDLGITPINAANILATIGGVGIVGRVAFGTIADRIGNKQTYIIGSILASAALFWLLLVTDVWMLYLFALIIGLASGLASLSSPMTAEFFGLRSHGLIYGVVNVGYALGAATGPLLAGYIFDLNGGYQLAFLISAVIAVVGLISTMLLKPIRGEGRQNTVIAEH